MIVDELKKFIKDFNLTDHETSTILRVAQSSLSEYLSGKTKISRDRAENIRSRMAAYAAAHGKVRPNASLMGLVGVPKRRVPVVSWALAGEMKGRGSFEDLANQISEDVDTMSRDPNAFAIEISGDSMEPTVSPGDVVVLEPNMEAPVGWPVLVKLVDGRVFFKRLYRALGKIILQSDNPDHVDLEFEQSEIAFLYPAKDIHKTARPRTRRV